MAILIPDFSLEGLNEAQALEVLNALQHIYDTQADLEAAANQGIQQFAEYDVWTTQQGHTFINTGTRLAGEYMGPTVSSTETALELAQDAYDASVLDAQGNVIYKYNAAQGAMGGAGGAAGAQATSLLALDVGMVGAAVAPILGVSLGAGLYESNPEFWTKLSQRLLPFCYEGTTQIPGWLDIVESALHPGEYETHAVIDKRIVDVIKQFFNEEIEGYEHPAEEATDADFARDYPEIVQPVIFAENFSTVVRDGVAGQWYSWEASGAKIVLQEYYGACCPLVCSTSPFTVTEKKQYRDGDQVVTNTYSVTTPTTDPYGRTIYIWRPDEEPSADVFNITSPPYWHCNTINREATAGLVLYGNASSTIEYPEGTSEWQGYTPSLSPYSKPIMYFKRDPINPDMWISDPQDGIEITVQKKSDSVPSGEPYPSSDPEAEPDPNRTSNPKNALSNLGNSAPGTNTDPAEEPQPEPEVDPSIPNPVIAPVIPADPPGPPGVEPPPPDSGSSPPVIPPIVPLPFSPTNDGLISVYHPTDAQLKAFASWLWVTYADPSIEKLWNNPFDGVIGLMELYCTPTDIGTKTIRSGFLDSGVSSAIISRYTEIDCGTIFVPEYYKNYLDYSPYSKCHVYLPFIGIVELNVDDIVGHGVNITYRIDEYNGSCIAQIKVAKYTEVNGEPVTYDNIMYQFSGNCAVELPLAGGTQAAIRAGLIQAAAYGLSSVIGGIVSGVSGNIGGAVSQIGYGAANAIGSVVSAKSSVQHSGSFGSSFGALGCKKPFITVSRPKQISVLNYPDLYGFPAHCAVTIGACTGYIRVREVNVKSATASDEEKALIESLLKEGVYV